MSQANVSPSAFGATPGLSSTGSLSSALTGGTSLNVPPPVQMQPGMEPCTIDNPMGMGDPSHGQIMTAAPPPDPCPTCSAAPKKRSNTSAASVTTYQAGPVVAGRTTDLATGQSYTSVGLSWPPGVGMSEEACVVTPFGNNTAADVITGPSAGLMYTGELAGPSGAVYGNTSGLMWCGGVSTGVSGGAAATGTYTW